MTVSSLTKIFKFSSLSLQKARQHRFHAELLLARTLDHHDAWPPVVNLDCSWHWAICAHKGSGIFRSGVGKSRLAVRRRLSANLDIETENGTDAFCALKTDSSAM
jgi:hypothetical protein